MLKVKVLSRRFFSGSVASICMLALLGCDTSKQTITPIAEVLSRQSHYMNRNISVRGEVTQAISFLGQGGFLLKDETGSIPILAANVAPRLGEKLLVRGKVQHLATLNHFSSIVIVVPQ